MDKSKQVTVFFLFFHDNQESKTKIVKSTGLEPSKVSNPDGVIPNLALHSFPSPTLGPVCKEKN
jgi:hypothetical protein